mgnify:CR=1 FL=1|tara:strand:+ start:1541 stop:2062 length:522 start_codon:yes stop_codon:yes gene_type:complete
MDSKLKLLLNLEENIFHLVQKRCYNKESSKRCELDTEALMKELNTTNKIEINKKYILSGINTKLEINENLVDMYGEKFGYELIDLDILNLIIKYISTCGKILQIEMQDLCGVRALDYQPNHTVKYLDPEYIINKYPKGYGFGVSHDTLNTFKNIFLNIIIPFGNYFLISIYRI